MRLDSHLPSHARLGASGSLASAALCAVLAVSAASLPQLNVTRRPTQSMPALPSRAAHATTAVRPVDPPAVLSTTAPPASAVSVDSPAHPALASLVTPAQVHAPNAVGAPIAVAAVGSRVSRLVASGLDVAVTTYSDCAGNATVPSNVAAIDTCFSAVRYFVGHNPGVFTPLLNLGPGSVITWWDHAGVAHHLQVVAARTWDRANESPTPVSPAVVAQFQTCLTSDGSVDRILDAVSIDPAPAPPSLVSAATATVAVVTTTVAATTTAATTALSPVIGPLAGAPAAGPAAPQSPTAPQTTTRWGSIWAAYFANRSSGQTSGGSAP